MVPRCEAMILNFYTCFGHVQTNRKGGKEEEMSRRSNRDGISTSDDKVPRWRWRCLSMMAMTMSHDIWQCLSISSAGYFFFKVLCSGVDGNRFYYFFPTRQTACCWVWSRFGRWFFQNVNGLDGVRRMTRSVDVGRDSAIRVDVGASRLFATKINERSFQDWEIERERERDRDVMQPLQWSKTYQLFHY